MLNQRHRERRRNNAPRNPKFPPEKSRHVRALCRRSRTIAVPTLRGRLKMSINVRSLEHDPEKWIPVFEKDHAPAISWSEMTIRGKVMSL
jgi:hypothetical protein